MHKGAKQNKSYNPLQRFEQIRKKIIDQHCLELDWLSVGVADELCPILERDFFKSVGTGFEMLGFRESEGSSIDIVDQASDSGCAKPVRRSNSM